MSDARKTRRSFFRSVAGAIAGAVAARFVTPAAALPAQQWPLYPASVPADYPSARERFDELSEISRKLGRNAARKHNEKFWAEFMP
jgi:hypothetical protein